MGHRAGSREIDGILLLDKPAGMSSNQALLKVRGLLQAGKAGHAGTLDPFATGMLPICLGEATKTAAFMLQAGKAYRATMRLGQATATGDLEGAVVRECAVPPLSLDDVESALSRHRGVAEQVPPMYSALKHQGRPLYELARQGIEVERAPRRVIIHRLEQVAWETPFLSFEVECSKGTYVRTLAEDLAVTLGSCAHLVALRRLSVGDFPVSRMVNLEQVAEAVRDGLEREILLPVDAGLLDWPLVRIVPELAARFVQGNMVPADGATGWVRVYGTDDVILGLGEASAQGELRPKRVFRRIADQA